MKILGIETSCDDTGLALICNDQVIKNKILKQEHVKGVIPEYAARAHHQALLDFTKEIIEDQKIDLIAYTNGPGLIGSLFVGSSFAKALAYGLEIPTVAVNHLHAHIILPYWLQKKQSNKIIFPYMCLLISGGHTMLVYVEDIDKYKVLSTTLDDAIGEVFDKVARYIGLPYPGGPEVEKMAKKASNKKQFKFPDVMKNSENFSFSGLKTAAMKEFDGEEESIPDFCACFQAHVAKLLHEKLQLLLKKYSVKDLVISGGVAANCVIREKIKTLKNDFDNLNIHYPPIELCTDNAVMIAGLGQLLFEKNGASDINIKPKSTCDHDNLQL